MIEKKKKSWVYKVTLALLAIFFLVMLRGVYEIKQTSFADKDLIKQIESPYNNIFVYKDSDGIIHMTFGYRKRRFVESRHNPADPLELLSAYAPYMTMGVAYAKEAASMLQIGMGGGNISMYLHDAMPQMQIDEVEIDPAVVDVAKEYFNFKETELLRAHVIDGRKFLMNTDKKYDLILLDAYRGSFVPFHLLTVEFFEEVKKHLNPGGVVVQNIEPNTMLFDSAVETIRQVFPNVDLYSAGTNSVAVAYEGDPRGVAELKEKAKALQETYKFRYALPDMLEKRKTYTPQPAVKPLTDDFAPVDALKAIERHNQKADNHDR